MRLVLRVDQVAKRLDVSEKWVYQNKEKIPGYFKINGLIRFNQQKFLKGIDGLDPVPTKRNGGPEDRHDLL